MQFRIIDVFREPISTLKLRSEIFVFEIRRTSFNMRNKYFLAARLKFWISLKTFDCETKAENLGLENIFLYMLHQ